MINNENILNPVELEICAEKLVKELVCTRIIDGKQFINMPIVYPNGDGIALQLHSLEDGLCICDNASAFREACLMGIDHKYHEIASKVAKRYNASVEDGLIFLRGLKQEELAAAAIWVATASIKTVETLLNDERGGD